MKKIVPIIIATVLIGLFLVFLVYQFAFPALPADIYYSLDESVDHFYPDSDNAVNLYCSNGGGKEGNFYLVLNLTNASFSDKTEQPYVLVNATNEVPFPSGQSWRASGFRQQICLFCNR